jgi:tRNA (cmo5U34)-methyltransferase
MESKGATQKSGTTKPGDISRPGQEWREQARSERWLGIRDRLPGGAQMREVLLEDVIGDRRPRRVLDLGTGGGALIADVRSISPSTHAYGLDISPPLLAAARMHFAGEKGVHFREHDLGEPLPTEHGRFDLIISAWVIHHLPDERKQELYREVFDLLEPGGLFCNMDLIALPTEELQRRALAVFASMDEEEEDSSDQPAAVETQLTWLRDDGFENVDCYWKWLATAMMVGERPA